MTAVRFERRGDTHAVTFAYDPIVVEMLKATVPSFVRSWNPVRREWLILEPVHAAQFADTLRELGHTVIGLDESSRSRSDDSPAHWARILFRRVGPARASKVYRALSKCFHPDTGSGDTELQSELNTGHAEITPCRKEPA